MRDLNVIEVQRLHAEYWHCNTWSYPRPTTLGVARMWLIENPNNRFLTDPAIVDSASDTLRKAVFDKGFTLVVGNGPSQSAAWYHRLRNRSTDSASISWSEVVQAAARKIHDGPFQKYHEEFVKGCRNNLALAQAFLVNDPNPDEASSRLIEDLRGALLQHLDPNDLDHAIVALAQHDVITTNYDFQIERALQRARPHQWTALVRTHSDYQNKTDFTWVHKMHGSFVPPPDLEQYYRFPDVGQSSNTIVIAERDYDRCFKELSTYDAESHCLFSALRCPTLIIGKMIDAQDISFMFSLRASRNIKSRRFALLADLPTPDERLMLDNLLITPLVINMPRDRKSGHYYFGVLAALGRLFGGQIEEFFKRACQSEESFYKLARGPVAMAVGLSSKNVTGIPKYNDETYLLTAGRRNLRFDSSEEHLGGSALTAILVFSKLCEGAQSEVTRSLVGAIGVPQDANAQDILKGCAKAGIDTDAISQNQDSSWHSTVLIHSSKVEGVAFEGQRIFLDRGYEGKLVLEPEQFAQTLAQIANPNLKILYCDKFLAARHPPLKSGQKIDEKDLGPLLQGEMLAAMQDAVAARPDIDIVYETGGGGSQFKHVEERLKHLVNVFTAGFPFFANAILVQDYGHIPAIAHFAQGEWYNSEFDREVAAADEFLSTVIGIDPSGKQEVMEFTPAESLFVRAECYAGREAAARRWFIATLHHKGAIGLDLKSRRGWFSPAPKIGKVMNTSGAGDTFRGALMYALLQEINDDAVSLPAALSFATMVASRRCQYFKMQEALDAFGREYSITYYESHRSKVFASMS